MKTVVIVYEKKICVNSIKTKSLFYQFCNNNSCTIQTSIFMVYSTTFESCKIIVKIQKDFWEEGRSQKHSPMSYSFTRFSVQHAYNHSSTVFENHRKSLISNASLRASLTELCLHFSGQKLIRNAKNGSFWRVFENLKLAVKQCYQTGQF